MTDPIQNAAEAVATDAAAVKNAADAVAELPVAAEAAVSKDVVFAQQEGQHIAHTFLDAIEHLVKLVREHL